MFLHDPLAAAPQDVCVLRAVAIASLFNAERLASGTPIRFVLFARHDVHLDEAGACHVAADAGGGLQDTAAAAVVDHGDEADVSVGDMKHAETPLGFCGANMYMVQAYRFARHMNALRIDGQGWGGGNRHANGLQHYCASRRKRSCCHRRKRSTN